jgi:hypothetical protein
MTVIATLEEVRDEAGDTQSWGAHAFVQLPAQGDRIMAVKDRNHQEMTVLYVLHRAVRAYEGEPGATVYGRFK